MVRVYFDSLPPFFDYVKLDARLRALVEVAVGGRKRLARELFTDSAHYEVFNHLKKRPAEVMAGQRYVVLRYSWRRRYDKTSTYYVVGINSDGKLFINKLASVPWPEERAGGCGCVELHVVRDEAVMNVMGFDVDLEQSNVRSIPIEAGVLRYRLQGDLVLEAGPIKDVGEAYETELRWFLASELERHMSFVLARRASLVLSSRGISTSLRGERVVFEAIPRRTSSRRKEELVDKVGRLLSRELYYQDMGEALVERRFGESAGADKVSMSIYLTAGTIGSGYDAYAIELKPSAVAVLRAVEEAVRSIKFEAAKRVVHFGRHRLEVEAFPPRLTLLLKSPASDPEGLEERLVLSFQPSQLHVVPCELRVSHPEHGTVRYEVAQGLVATLRSVRTDPDFDLRLSHYSLKHL